MHFAPCIRRRCSIHFWNMRFKARERNVGWRLDYFLVDKALQESTRSSAVWTTFMVRTTALWISRSIWANFIRKTEKNHTFPL